MSRHTSRLVATFLCGLVIAIAGSTVVSRPAYAVGGVGDIVHDPLSYVPTSLSALKNTVIAAKSLITGAASAKILTNPIFYRIAQAAIHSMVRSTVNWINSGFQGSPAYATDLPSTILDASDVEAEKFVGQLAHSSGIKSPFSDKVSKELISAYYLSTSKDGFQLQNPYTLNKVSTNDTEFLKGDFRQGGFQAWFATVLNPQNNPIGAGNLAQTELNNRIESAGAKLHEELGWGNGFFSYRKCDTPAPASNKSCPAGSIDTGDGSGCQASGNVNLNAKSTCLSSHIETPGSVIAGSLNHTLGLGADSLIQAKDFDEIVNALLGQLINNVLGSSGLGGLSHGSTATGGRAYFDQPTSSNTSAGLAVVSSFTQILDQQTSGLQGYLTNWQSISSAASAAKTAVTNSTCLLQAQKEAEIDAQIQPVITQAATAIGAVPTGLSAIDAIRTQALNVVSSTDSTQQTEALQKASSDYNDLLASNKLPSVSDFNYATAQSQDATSITDPGTGATTVSTPTLLSQMNDLATQARCGK